MIEFDPSNLVCSQKYQKRIAKRALESSARTALFDSFISKSLVVDDHNTHTPIMRGRGSNFSHEGSLSAEDDLLSDRFNAGDWALFSNPLRIPTYGPRYTGPGEHYAKHWEKPSDRAVVGNFWVFTLEHDPDEPSGFQEQLDWLWAKKQDRESVITAYDNFLRQEFRDYRGYNAVWTGNKSIHFHFVFDTTWLDRSALENWAAINGSNPKHALVTHYEGDINPSLIWEYYKVSWCRLVSIFKDTTGVDVQFDPGMQILSQKRRLPWGTRIEEKDSNIHGYEMGTAIPQIVLEERIGRTAPKGAPGYFLRASEANAMKLPAKARSRKAGIIATTVDSEAKLLTSLTEHLAAEWGNPFPKPARIDVDGGVYFYNHAGDQNPSTYLGPNYAHLCFRGSGAPTDPSLQHLPGHLSLADTMYVLADGLAESIDVEVLDAPSHQQSRQPGPVVINSVFEKKLESGTPRTAMSATAPLVLGHSPYTLIKSVEGVGKSHAVLSNVIEHRLQDCADNEEWGLNRTAKDMDLTHPGDGFIIFASSSYAQSEEQFENYTTKRNGSNEAETIRSAVLLKSFSQWYREYFASLPPNAKSPKPIKWTDALQTGHRSLLDAVYETQPAIYQKITKQKNAAWKIASTGSGRSGCGFHRRFDVPIFCPYDLAHSFHRQTPSTAWLHPNFDYAVHAEDPKVLASQFRAYLIIHDEISIDNLLWSASPEEVTFAHMVRESCDEAWSGLSMVDRYTAYRTIRASHGSGISFERTIDLIDANFTDDCRVEVCFDDLPYGHDNGDAGLYNGTDGQVFYLKQKSWWRDCKGRVIFLTTENLVTDIVASLRWPSGCEGVPDQKFSLFSWDADDLFEAEHLPLRLDPRASKSKIDELVGELLDSAAGGFDHVITNHVQRAGVSTHVSARGRNDLTDRNIASVLTYLGPGQYALLNVISQRFGVEDAIRSFYRDQINQAAGRNRGLRRANSDPKMSELVLSPRLYVELGGREFFLSGRYRFYRTKHAMDCKHGSVDSSQANCSGTG